MKNQPFYENFYKFNSTNSQAHIKKYLNAPSFTSWKKDPFLALAIYAQLADSFGFALYKKAFRRYITERIRPRNDHEEIQTWITVTSEAAGYNLVPIFEFWGYPIDATTKNKVKDLPAYLPDDMITKLVPSRVIAIVGKYAGITRKANKVDDIWKDETAEFQKMLPNDVRVI